MKEIKQTILFNASAADIYEYLTNARKLQKIIGGKVSSDTKPNGKFSHYDGYLFGTFVEAVPGKKIVMKWACEDFPKNQFSDIKIELKAKGPKQTELIFTQTNIPDELYEDLSVGLNEFYWDPIKDHLEDLMWK